MSHFLTAGKPILLSDMMTSLLAMLPLASAPYACVCRAFLPSRTAAFPSICAARTTPCPPLPPNLISVLFTTCLCLLDYCVNCLHECRTLSLNKFSHNDFRFKFFFAHFLSLLYPNSVFSEILQHPSYVLEAGSSAVRCKTLGYNFYELEAGHLQRGFHRFPEFFQMCG